MTIDRMIALLKIEHECMLRKAHGECDGKCEDCELVQDDGELHEMYTDVVGLLETMNGGKVTDWLKMTRHDMEMFVKDIIRETVRRGRQETCPYCHDFNKYQVGSELCKPIQCNEVVGPIQLKECNVFMADGQVPNLVMWNGVGGAACIDINYCPMCGRDLRGEADGAIDIPG